MTNTTTTIEKKSDFTAEELERIDNTIGSGWKLYLPEDSIYAVWVSGCRRCGGTGIYSKFHGECYRCTKQGRNPKTREVRKKSIKRLVNQILKIRTETLDQKIKRIAREEKAEAKRIAKLEAEQALIEQQTQQRIAEEKAMRDAEVKAEADKKEKFDALWKKLDCTNRTTVTGKVVYYAWKDSQFGGAYKIIVELENNIRIWGTCPSEVSKEDTVQFDCRLSRSDKDADFGYFSRPTKCKILQ